jgi:Flp pilus assembly protein TadB
MPMTDDATHDDTIEAVLAAAARSKAPAPSAELMARVLADAEATQAGFDRFDRQAERPKAHAGLRAVIAGFGGWPAMAGLTAAGLAGVWLGISPTFGVSEVLAGYLDGGAAYAVDVMPGAELGLAWEKGGF